MARANIQTIEALRKTARNLQKSNYYQWGHMGSCNCGYLAQQISSLDREEIHRRAMQKHGDWNEQLNDYCPDSGLPMDDLIHELTTAGFTLEDLQALERLSDPQILRKAGVTFLEKNRKEHVIQYLNAWARMLEEELLERDTIGYLYKGIMEVHV